MAQSNQMTWEQAARIAILGLEAGTETGKQMARDQIMQMATVADMAVELQQQLTAEQGDAA